MTGSGHGKALPRRFKSPVSVLWDMTGRCELNCLHCCNASGPVAGALDLSDDEVVGVARQLVEADIVDVCISGGEPLTRREVLHRIVPIFAEHQIVISLVTSGFGCTPEDAELFSRYRVRTVVSLDGASPEVHDAVRGRSGSFEQAVNAIKLLGERLISVKVIFLPVKANAHDFGNVVDLCASLGYIRVVEAHLMVERGRGALNRDQQISLEARQALVEQVAGKNQQYNGSISCVLNDPTLGLRRLARSTHPNYGVVIEHDGSLRASPWVPVTFGNVRERHLIDLWEEGLSLCWQGPALTRYLKGMRSVNALGSLAEQTSYEPVDYLSLQEGTSCQGI